MTDIFIRGEVAVYSRSIGAVLVALLAAAALGGPAAAQEPAFRGMFVRDSAAGDNMEQVITATLPHIKSTLGKIFKGTARKRLREVNRPYGWIEFTPAAGSMTTQTDHWNGEWKLSAPDSGTVTWRRKTADGDIETLRVASFLEGRTYTHRFIAEDGVRTNTYSLSPDGQTLTISVHVVSPKLSEPMNYKLVYKARS